MNKEGLLQVLVSPRISEKSTRIGDKHKQFVFEVAPNATKPDIKRAVEMMFNVQVANVQVLNLKGKTKMFRRTTGRRSDTKKAYVSLRPGFDIDFMGAG
jgi:large subunit ribosomal protein L23